MFQNNKRFVAVFLGLLAFVINPYWGCSGQTSAPQYEFGAEDMKKAVVGTWEGSMDDGKGKTVKFTLTLEAGKTAESKNPLRINCETRSFLSVAGACVDNSMLELKGTFSTDDGVFDKIAIKGSFQVYGLSFKGGELAIDTDKIKIHGQRQEDGSFPKVSVTLDGKTTEVAITRKAG